MADVEAAQEAKPVPTVAIVTDPAAAAQYDAEVESWGDRVHDAGVRTCRWLAERGLAVTCGKTSAEPSNKTPG